MWFIVNTDKFQEQKTKDFLDHTYPGIVKQVYLPKCRMTYVNAKGEEMVRFRPLIYGMLFVKADSVKALKGILTHWGYFVYEDRVRNLDTGKNKKGTLVSGAHLLCRDVKALDQMSIIKNATIPDEDMERFIYYSDKIADGIEGLSIVDKRYSDLILVNDTIRILSGPMAGWVGVIKQIKTKGKKDRHLLVRFGNNHCLNISNVRQYDMRIEHEATQGEKSEAVGAWRALDQMIGYLQAKEPNRNAPETLRQLFMDYLRKVNVYRNSYLSDIGYYKKKDRMETAHKQEILEYIDDSMQKNFRILAQYFHTANATLEQGLREWIPDAVLRPFLTPTSGVLLPEGQDHVVLQHNGIIELILRCNLREFFHDKAHETEEVPVLDEDYEYYAHLALLRTKQGKVKAITSWGGFYDYYAAQGKDERDRFINDLEAKKYHRLHQLLVKADSRIAFEKVQTIGGFSIETDVDYTRDAEAMAKAVAEQFRMPSSPLHQVMAAAVEMWQGVRLLVWRQLLQRYVLLHKVPVEDKQVE